VAFKIAELYAEITMKDSRFVKSLKQTRRSLIDASAQLQGFSRAARRMFLGASAAIGGLLFVFGRFEQAMARVQAITGASAAEFQKLEGAAEGLGRTTQFTAKQAADAMGYLAVAGFKTTQIVESMPEVLNLAAAGQLDMASASNIAAKIMRGMGIEAKDLGHAVDVLTTAFTTSNTDLNQLGEAMKYVGPVARSMGKSIEDVVADIQVLSDAGIQGGMAGTTLRNAYSRLAGAVPEAKKMLDRLGVATIDANGKLKNTAEIVRDLNKAMGGMGEAERSGVIMQIFGQRAGVGMTAMLSEGESAIHKFQKGLVDVGGTAKRIAEIQMATFYGALTRLKSAAEGLGISIGRALAPSITILANGLRRIVSWFDSWSSGMKKFIAGLGLAITAVLAIGASLSLLLKGLAFATTGLVVITGAYGKATAAALTFAKANNFLGHELMRAGKSFAHTKLGMLGLAAAAAYAGYKLGQALSPYLQSLIGLKDNEDALNDPRYEAAYEEKRQRLLALKAAADEAAAAQRRLREEEEKAAAAALEQVRAMEKLVASTLGMKDLDTASKEHVKRVGKSLREMVEASNVDTSLGPRGQLAAHLAELNKYMNEARAVQGRMGKEGQWNMQKLEEAYARYKKQQEEVIQKAEDADEATRVRQHREEMMGLVAAEIRSRGTLEDKIKLLSYQEQLLKRTARTKQEEAAIEEATDRKIALLKNEEKRKQIEEAEQEAKKKERMLEKDSQTSFVGIEEMAKKVQSAAFRGKYEEEKTRREKKLLQETEKQTKQLMELPNKMARELFDKMQSSPIGA